MNSTSILITAIGSFSADCAINTLKAKGYRIIGCDIYPAEWHPVSKDCDKVFRAPFATDERKYIDFILKTCTAENIGIIVPLTDLEIDAINRNRAYFENTNITIAMPSDSTLRVARDKYRLFKLFQNDNVVNTAPTYKVMVDVIPDNIVPCIAKPFNGRSSEGLKKITTSTDLETVLDNPVYIIQPLIDGPIITVDYVRSALTGHDFSVPRQELLRTKNGAGISVKVFEDTALSNTVSYIGKMLDINGCVNMEFILNNGVYHLIDINPRFSAGIAFSMVAGYDMVTSHINCHTGKDILPQIKITPQIVAKRYIEEVTKTL